MGGATELRQKMGEIEQSKERVVSGLERMLKELSYQKGVFVPGEQSTWYYFWRDGNYAVRLYTLTKHEAPGYFIERVSSDHWIANFDVNGKLSKVSQYDVQRMNKDHMSGYQTDYTQEFQVQKKDELLGSWDVLQKLQRYIDAFARREQNTKSSATRS